MPHFYVLHTHFRHLLQKPVYVKRNQYHEFQPLKFNWFIEGKNVIFSKVWPDVPTHQWWQVSNHDCGELITFYIFRALFSSTIYYQNLISSTVFYFKKSKNDTRECSLSFDHLKKKMIYSPILPVNCSSSKIWVHLFQNLMKDHL